MSSPSFGSRLLALLTAASSGVIFAAAEGGPTALVSVFAAIVAVLVVETGPKLAIPPWLAAIGGLAAAGLTINEFFSESIEGRLLSGGHFLAYLTAIIALQRKRLRDLAFLTTLAGLQVALSAVLTNAFWFASALIVFQLLLIWTLGTLLYERLIGANRAAAGAPVGSRLQNSSPMQLATPALAFTVPAFIAGFGMYYLMPHIWIGGFAIGNNDAPPGASSTVGFTDEVTLGDAGEIYESDEPVMTVKSTDPDTGEPIDLEQYVARTTGSEPRFRGAVLDIYEDGAWKPARAALSAALGRPEAEPSELFRHDIYLYPIGVRPLFTLGSAFVFAERDDGLVMSSRLRSVLTRTEDEPLTEPARYSIWSVRYIAETFRGAPYAPFSGSSPRPQTRVYLDLVARPPRELRTPLVGYLRSMPELTPIYDSLRETMQDRDQSAAQIEQQFDNMPLATLVRGYEPSRGGQPFSTESISDAIDRHFAANGFTYTLDAKVDDGTVDPILDFLQNRRTGHCEYYASAAALLNKAAGIPSRLVSGYKGGVTDEDLVFRVSQYNAHAWAETLHYRLAPEPSGSGSQVIAVWVTSDPTPSAREAVVAETRRKSEQRKANPIAFLRDLWSDAVFMTRTQQQDRIYDPIVERSKETWVSIQDFPDAFGALMSSDRGLSPEQRRSLSNVGRLLGAIVLIVGSVFGFRWWRTHRRRLGGPAAATSRKARDIPATPWYERLLSLAARRIGRRRAAPATQREYAGDVLDADRELGPVADLATGEYYRVRFGRKDPRAAVIESIESQVATIEQADDA